MVFAKHWTPGRAKTRLAAAIGDRPAAELALEFLRATMCQLEALPIATRRLAYAPRSEGGAFRRLASTRPVRWELEPQTDGDLGDRMQAVLSTAGSVVIVGSDTPDLPTAAVYDALLWLGVGEPRFVLAPTDDGGYWLVGGQGTPPPVFANMPWGGPTVLSESVDRLAAAGWRRDDGYRLLTPWYDVDTQRDLIALARRLAARDELPDHLDALLRRLRPYLSDDPSSLPRSAL
ncbi:MAG: TIGR04282 family arsenosugar biosynthesis glycosyltransferase [Planctomycetota bacterium]